MQGQSYQVKTVLEQYENYARNKTFLAFKYSPGNPLGRSHLIIGHILDIYFTNSEHRTYFGQMSGYPHRQPAPFFAPSFLPSH